MLSNSRERVRGVLAAFGQHDSSMEVFTDGEIQLRQWQLSTLPRARHILDWYHLRRRLEKLNAVVHGRPTASQLRTADHDWLSCLAGGLKWRLWHGRAQEARRRLAVMLYVLGKSTVCRKPAARQIRRLTLELLGYLCNNSDSLPNYGRRYREGRRISASRAPSWSPLSTSSLTRGCRSRSRCAGILAARTCCCRCGCASSTANCAMTSPAGTRGSRPTRRRYP